MTWPVQSMRPLSVLTGLKLSYGNEIVSYGSAVSARDSESIFFETDLAIVESVKPRSLVSARGCRGKAWISDYA
jgi:hypothetical protein